MTEVNLLPPELRRRHRARSRSRQVIAGVAAVILLLIVVWFFESSKLATAESDLAAQNATNVGLQTKISSLQRFADLQNQLNVKKELVADLEKSEVQWSGVLHDLSMVMPSDVFITSFDAQINLGIGGWETEVGPTGLIGTLQMSGVALNFPNVALWIDRMSNVTGWTNSWVTAAGVNASGDSSGASVTGVKFNGSIDLTPETARDGTPP
jgi:Tfp pilus assembly protein PilN